MKNFDKNAQKNNSVIALQMALRLACSQLLTANLSPKYHDASVDAFKDVTEIIMQCHVDAAHKICMRQITVEQALEDLEKRR